MNKKVIIGASVGNCVHVAGVVHFLNMAQEEGFESIFLGPAIKMETLEKAIKEYKPMYVAIGYRLTPENFAKIMPGIIEINKALDNKPSWIFGGTMAVAKIAESFGFFDTVFDGMEDLDDCISFLRTGKYKKQSTEDDFVKDLVSGINKKKPYPLLRHHFGLPSFKDTEKGIKQISESRVLDIISLGIDQNTQEFFFHPEKRNPDMDGAGGVPVINEQQFRLLKDASKTGNHPLMRCYSGTSDVMRFGKMLVDTISNAWCAVPLCWYNELDGRGTRRLDVSIQQAQKLMQWHGQRNIPVELNEPHHWGLRDAHDVISVVMAYISAYNAKRYDVKDYIAQYMFNIPNSLSFAMDLAKVMAQIELVEALADKNFRTYRQVRAGLPFLSSDMHVAKGQLASSTYLSMAVSPHIIHVVGYSEGQLAATPEIVIESCKIVRGVIRSVLHGNADQKKDPAVQQRKEELLKQASYLINFIKMMYQDKSEDPLSDAHVLSDCIKKGILDAPHILKNEIFTGNLNTRMNNGSCLAYDSKQRCYIDEKQRLFNLTGKEIM